MDDSNIRTTIKLIETRIDELSKKDPAKNEQAIREFEELRESLLKKEEEEEEDVDMDDQEEDDEEEEYVDELEKKFEKRRLVNVIIDLLNYDDDDDEHESEFTPDLVDNLPDGDPMLLLSNHDLAFIHNSVEKLSDCSYYHRIAISKFCEEAKEWLERPTHPNDVTVSRITYLRDSFPKIISALDEKLKNPEDLTTEDQLLHRHALARALALMQSYNNNNNPDTNTDSDDESKPDKKFKLSSHSDSNSEEEEKKKSPILERDGEEEFYDHQGWQTNSSDRKRLKTSDEEQQEKSYVQMSSKFEHDGAML